MLHWDVLVLNRGLVSPFVVVVVVSVYVRVVLVETQPIMSVEVAHFVESDG
jgi:hypothetical protein